MLDSFEPFTRTPLKFQFRDKNFFAKVLTYQYQLKTLSNNQCIMLYTKDK